MNEEGLVDRTYLKDDTRFFEQIDFDIGTGDFASWTEMDSNEFTLRMKRMTTSFLACTLVTYESRRVVVSGSFGISIGLQYRI